VACDKDAFPLSDRSEAREAFIRDLNFYTSADACEVATWMVMGNHYHLILRMKPYQELSQKDLESYVEKIYPNTHDQTRLWTESHWEQFNRRVFSLPDLMRNIQQLAGYVVRGPLVLSRLYYNPEVRAWMTETQGLWDVLKNVD
jgi:hypothetical protein